MTSYGAVEAWGAPVNVPAGAPHLTRRGRMVRAAVLLVVMVAMALWALGRLGTSPAHEDGAVVPMTSATLQVTVQEGDSLWAIARATAPNDDPREMVLEIRELNGLTSNTIQPGQVLLVPTHR